MNLSASDILTGKDRMTDEKLGQMSRRLSTMRRAVTGLLNEIAAMERRIQAARDERPLTEMTPISTEAQ